MGGEDEVEILEPYELKYSELKLLVNNSDYHYYNLSSKSSFSSSSPKELIKCLLENLGPTGPGLITVTGVPNGRRLRRMLLPLARRLALLNSDYRKNIFKEHSLGSDVSLKNPDRIVSSFAMQLKYLQCDESNTNQASPKEDENEIGEEIDFKNLGKNFKELGICMMELGLCLARICDRALNGLDLEQSLLESCTAKGRLIHYHSTSDCRILKDGEKNSQTTNRRATKPSTRNESTLCGNESNLWQQWHYDYGIFTILTSPMFTLPCHKQEVGIDRDFCLSCERECPSPSGHTFLKIFNKNKSRVQMVKADPESFIVQVGEAAEILSKGRLCANLHSVNRSEKIEELSRETFVVFLQPRWDKTLSIPDYPIESSQSDVQDCESEGTSKSERENYMLGQELHKIVPPLSSRLKDGMTFAEFSQETTKQYYGGRGLQAKR